MSDGLVEVEVVRDEHSRDSYTHRLAEYAEVAFRRGIMDTPVMKFEPAALEAAHSDDLIGATDENSCPGLIIRTTHAGDLEGER